MKRSLLWKDFHGRDFLNKRKLGLILAGAAAGSVNGLFGAGGGMVLVPLLVLLTDIREEDVFSASIGIILPVCLVSLAVNAGYAPLPWREALPYLIGSGIGGFLAGFAGKKIPVNWLHRLLGVLILWGGYRYLC
jgi:uncharacterized membrane protein YfcA